MREVRKLLDVLRTVPLLHVDVAAARARGDHEAIRYARAIDQWQADAARVLKECDQEPPQRPDAFERCAVASELSRLPAANLNDVVTVPA